MAKLTLKTIAEMSDEEVYKLSMPRPSHPEARGFLFNPRGFENTQEMAVSLSVLMKGLDKIKKEN